MQRSSFTKATRKFILTASAAALLAMNTGYGVQSNWFDVTGGWQTGANWDDSLPPVSAVDTSLWFGLYAGDVNQMAGTYTATNDFAGGFTLNEIVSFVYDAFPETSGLAMSINGNAINFAGVAPKITIESTGTLNITAPVTVTGGQFGLAGFSIGRVNLNNTTPISGLHTFDVSGPGTLNFNALVTPGTNEIALTGIDEFGIINLKSTAGTITGVNQFRVDGAGNLNIATPIQLPSALTVTGAGLGTITLGNTTQATGLSHVTQNGTGNLTFDTPFKLSGTTTWDGSGTGTVTFNNTLSGLSNIVKSGASTFRFGTYQPDPLIPVPSNNTWFGSLTIEGGTVRFNNNAESGATAIRSNPVIFSGAGGTLSIRRDDDDDFFNSDTSLRVGTLSGATGAVTGIVTGSDNGNFDIVITAMQNGTYGGSLTLPAPTGTGGETGKFIVRGTSNQTLTGSLSIHKDVTVGRGATLTLAGGASLGGQTKGAVTLNGGTLVLDNVDVNQTSRLRDPASASSTGLESIGGGTISLVGNAFGSTETVGRIQLGAYAVLTSQTKPRSGALNINVVHNAGNTAPTAFTFTGYSRDIQQRYQYATVNFSATDGSGTPMSLGLSGNNPRIHLNGLGSITPLDNGNLLNSTGGGISSGWATVNGTDFATHSGIAGVEAVFSTAWSGALTANDNASVTGSVSTPGGGADYDVNTIKIAPSVASQTLNIAGSGNLATTGVLLSGAIDYAITSTGGGGLAASNTSVNAPRFFHVAVEKAKLRLEPNLAVSANSAVVKSGPGVLELIHAGNAALAQPVVINQGVVRATPGTSLPNGELQLRGGVLEIVGGGTFTRGIGFGAGKVNWEGIEFDALLLPAPGNIPIPEDRGSGGFAAFGTDAIVDLNGAGTNDYMWEEMGFLSSGHALIFGSATANRRITLVDNISLTAADPGEMPNYNAREFSVVDNTSVTTDFARLSGVISGNVQNDFLKTGDGTLEFTGANTYLGATQVADGTLLVNGNNSASFLHIVRSGAILGGKGTTGAIKVEAGGKLAPGEYAGETSNLTTGDVTFESTAEFHIDMGGSTVGGDGTTGYDRLTITGGVTLGGASLVGSKLGGFNASAGQLYFIMVNDGADAVNGQFAQGLTFTFGSQTFDVSYVANFDGTSFVGGNDVALRLVPEPSTALLLLAGGAAGLIRRRRK